jgi:hypothetical protein
MRHVTLGLFALAVVVTPLAAQRGEQPNIVLTIFAGAGTGHGLWTIAKQPLQVLGTSEYDTLRLSQGVTSSIIVGLAATYFPSPHFGLHGEISYVGLPVDGSCTGVFYNPDFDNKNQQTCDDIQRSGSDGGSIALFVGATLRAAPRGSFSPYARLNVGIINETRSTIEMSGTFIATSSVGVREVLTDPKPRHAASMFGAAVGFTRPISPGYQFRWEMSDLVVSMSRATGIGILTAGAGAIPPTASKFYHHFSLKLGLDVVLEKKRGRRY